MVAEGSAAGRHGRVQPCLALTMSMHLNPTVDRSEFYTSKSGRGGTNMAEPPRYLCMYVAHVSCECGTTGSIDMMVEPTRS
jgi:hypothetical protein